MSVDAANTMSIVGGTLWVDRHLHKNGGSTMREVMLRNEEAGNCVYYGYTQTREGWDRLMSYMRSINSSTASLPRVCIEAHASQASAEFTSRRIPDLLRLRAIYTQWAVPIRVVLTVRVREPLSYYISFYRWRVAGLQRGGNIIRLSPKKSVYQPLGTDFLGWSPPNLQSIGLLHGDVELFAGLKAGGWPGVRNATRRPHPYWSAHQSFEAQHYTDLLTTLGHYDVVAPLEAFDEHLLLIAERTGIKPLQAVEHAKVVPEAQGMRGVRLKDLQVCPNMSVASPNVLVPPPTSLGLCPPLLTALGATCQVCPNMSACRAHVERIAPWDVKLYNHVRATFAARVEGAGGAFAPLLQRYRDARQRNALGVCDPAYDAPEASRCCCADRLPCFNWTGRERTYRMPPACVPGPLRVQQLVASDMPLGWCCTWRPPPPPPRARRRHGRGQQGWQRRGREQHPGK